MLGFFSRTVLIFGLCFGVITGAKADDRVLFVQSGNGFRVGLVDIGATGKVKTKTQTFSLSGTFTKAVQSPSGVVAFDSTSGKMFQFTADGFGNIAVSPSFYTPLVSVVKQAARLRSLILLYDGTRGGDIAQYGLLSATQTDATLGFSPWTNVFATENYFFFYHSSTGVYVVGTASNLGLFGQSASSSTEKGLKLFATIGDQIFAYNPSTGRYMVLKIAYRGNGSDDAVEVDSGVLGKGFTSVAQQEGKLLVYNSHTGASLVGRLDRTTGHWVQTQKFTGKTGWTNEVSTGRNILFYKKSNGAVSVGYINDHGLFVTTDTSTIPGGFGIAAALPD